MKRRNGVFGELHCTNLSSSHLEQLHVHAVVDGAERNALAMVMYFMQVAFVVGRERYLEMEQRMSGCTS